MDSSFSGAEAKITPAMTRAYVNYGGDLSKVIPVGSPLLDTYRHIAQFGARAEFLPTAA